MDELSRRTVLTGLGLTGLAALTRSGVLVSPAWARTGAFLGPSISSFVRDNPLPTIVRWFHDAGIRHVRTRGFLLGTWIVLWGVKER